MISYKRKQDLEENKNRTLLQSHAKTEFLTVVGQSVLWSYEQNACCLARCSPKGYKLEIHTLVLCDVEVERRAPWSTL